MKKLVEVNRVAPGTQFTHYGLAYTRATDDETHRHPGRELAERRNRPLVFAYQGEGDSRQPVTFVPDVRVVVETQKRGARRG